jgi:tetratricopeptide (TPR) repeat protein
MALLVAATVAAYSTSLQAPFQFDDSVGIADNVTIRTLRPLLGDTGPLHPPARSPLTHRPVVNVSLALNHALNEGLGIDNSGPWAPFSYRVFNVTVHLISAFLLFGVLRRTLRHGAMGAKFAAGADLIAIAAVFIWALHPLQSEALLYIVQRTELMMAACYLGALYCSIRAWDAPSRAAAAVWYLAAVVVGLVGMGCKEVMISMPLAVLLYDRAFRNESWRQTFRRRWWFYGPLGLTTSFLMYLMNGGPRSDTIGFHLGIASFEYLYTQCWAILRYVQLFFWPDRLTLDYGPQMIRDGRGIPGVIALTAFGVLTAAVWIKPRCWMWWGAGAAALATGITLTARPELPEILVLGMSDRVYGPLALAASITFFVIGAVETVSLVVRVRGWVWLVAALAAWAGVLGLLWVRIVSFPPEAMRARPAYMAIGSLLVLASFALRALAPRMPVNRWGWLGFLGAWFFMILAPSSSVVPIATEMAAERRIYLPLAAVIVLVLLGVEALRRRLEDPTGAPARAWQVVRTGAFAVIMIGLVVATAVRGSMYNDTEAIWRDVTAKVPENARGWDNLGGTFLQKGRVVEGEAAMRRALAVEPGYLPGWQKLGALAIRLGRPEEGQQLLRQAILLAPNHVPSLSKLGAVLIDLGRPREAIPYLERALAAEPTAGDWATYGVALAQSGRLDGALGAFDVSLMLEPNQMAAHINKAGTLINAGRYAEAVPDLRAALERDPRSVVAHANLAMAYAGLGQADQAIRAGQDAIDLAPQSARLRVMVGSLLTRFGRFADAEQHLMRAVQLVPGDPDALFQLGVARHYLGKRTEAIAAFRQALQVNGNYRPAREALEQLGVRAPLPQ